MKATAPSITALRAMVLLLVPALAAGCAQKPPTVSALQRFDRLRGGLHRVTVDSERVSSTWAALSRALHGDDAESIRRSARAVAQAAGALSSSAGAYASTIRSLRSSESQRVVRRYFDLLLQTLSDQWWEAHWVQQLAALVLTDPFLEEGTDLQRFQGLVRAARADARMAVSASQRAAALKRQNPSAFRYIPVVPSG